MILNHSLHFFCFVCLVCTVSAATHQTKKSWANFWIWKQALFKQHHKRWYASLPYRYYCCWKLIPAISSSSPVGCTDPASGQNNVITQVSFHTQKNKTIKYVKTSCKNTSVMALHRWDGKIFCLNFFKLLKSHPPDKPLAFPHSGHFLTSKKSPQYSHENDYYSFTVNSSKIIKLILKCY